MTRNFAGSYDFLVFPLRSKHGTAVGDRSARACVHTRVSSRCFVKGVFVIGLLGVFYLFLSLSLHGAVKKRIKVRNCFPLT